MGLEPTRGCLTNTGSAAELPTQSRVPCGNRTRLSRVEAWYLCRSAKGTCSSIRFHQGGSRGTRTHNGLAPAPAFEAGSSSGRMTSIRRSCGDRNRTCVTTVNSRLPVPARTPPQCFAVSVVGFEPTVSCPRSTRISRLSYTLLKKWIVDSERKLTISHLLQLFPIHCPLSTSSSTQRELNPHLRPGETVRCRYVMGASSPGRVVKEQSAEHRVGLEPTLPHYGCGVFAAKRPVRVREET